jgi:transposase
MSPHAQVAVIGTDIGKNSFHIVGHDKRGAIVLRQKWSRGQVEARLANLPPCLIGMEACVGAHHRSRKLNGFGHDARLMPAKYVRPYSKGQKNDFRDAEAIAEAVQRPTLKFVTHEDCRPARPAGIAPSAGTVGQPARRQDNGAQLPDAFHACSRKKL